MTPWHWKELTVVSPVVDGKGEVALSNPITGLRVEVGLNDILDLLANQASGGEDTLHIQDYLKKKGFLSEGNIMDINSDLEHWAKRGWNLVLDYYLWSQLHPIKEVINPYSSIATNRKDINMKRLTSPIELPEELLLGEVILKRRTLRRYADKPIVESRLSSLLWYGLNRLRNPVNTSSDRHDSFVTYIAVYKVKGIEPGLYRYYPDDHGLEPLVPGMLREQFSHLLFGQSAPLTAVCSIFLVSNLYEYACQNPREGSLRGLFVEAGRYGHELLIAASALGLGGLPAPAIREKEAAELLPVKKTEETILYTLTLGERQTPERSETYDHSNARKCSHTTN
ncbi:SagB/ThcOx family dehydrogenase [Cytobacillus firmus]